MTPDSVDLDRLAPDVLRAVMDRSKDAKAKGHEQPFLCPSHKDTNPAGCSYNANKRAWKCLVCGEGGGLLDLAGRLDFDLDLYRTEPTPETTRQNGHAKAAALEAPPDLGPAKGIDWARRFVAFYDWRDIDGVLRFRVGKTADKRFPTFQPAADGERWHAKMTGVPAFLYHVADLERLAPGSTVVVCEGEKDADRLRAEGLDATTFPGWCRNRWPEAGAPLYGNHVIILADNDDAGRAKASEASVVAHGAGAATVRVLNWPTALGANGQPVMLAAGFDASDYLDGHGSAADLLRLGRTAPESTAPKPKASKVGRVVETYDRQLRDVGSDALDVLRAENESRPAPVVYRRTLGLAGVAPDDEGRPVIQPHDVDTLRALLSKGATWTRTTPGGKSGPRVAAVNVPRDVLSYCFGANFAWDVFPRLRGIATAPILLPGGRILSRPGYDVGSGIVYAGPIFDIPDAPPTDDELEHARALILYDLLGDFPFVNDASRAHAVAYGLLPFVRHYFAGPAACFLNTAPQAGHGKSLLVDALARPFIGAPVPFKKPAKEEELGKWITAKILQGSTHAVIDNLPSKLDSAALASTITAEAPDERILGQTKAVTVRNLTIWALTGNNVAMTEELARRCYWTRLDAGVENPQDRDPRAFRHANLTEWITEHRAELVGAYMTLIRAWCAQGRPHWTGRPSNGFEGWSRTIGGILEGVTQGRTPDELLASVREAIGLTVESRRAVGLLATAAATQLDGSQQRSVYRT